ncbi:MAG: RsmB/NOP family class I SAM-dependent RNA methyltransferase [Candidatus Thorarchaeota archaeon]
MVDRYIQILGLEQTIRYLEANELPLTPSIRTNTLKITPSNLKKKLEKKGFELEPIEWVSYSYNVLKAPYNLGSTHEFLQGYYYLQNVASMLPAIVLNPKSSDTVVDMCAAPGSKASHLAQLMNNKGKLILIDKYKNRIPALEVNLRRLGIINSLVLNFNSINLPKLKIKADKILLDAPCTGEGLIRQDRNRKRSKKVSDIEKMSSIQKKLLQAGLKSLKPSGKLLYSTCSIGPEENEMVINDILKREKIYSILEMNESYGVEGLTNVYGKSLCEDLKHSQRLYPHIHDTIGFFLCLIQRDNA